MKKLLPAMIVLILAFSGCGKTVENVGMMLMEKPEVVTIDIARTGKLPFYPFVGMSASTGFVTISDSPAALGSGNETILYCFDTSNGKIAWEKAIKAGYAGLAETGKVFVRIDEKLSCLDLATGNIVWKSQEDIDQIQKAIDDRVFCVGYTKDYTAKAKKKLICFNGQDGSSIWSSDIPEDFIFGFYGKDEIAFFESYAKNKELSILDAKTGELKKKVPDVMSSGMNFDQESEALYQANNQIYKHTPVEEVSIYKFDENNNVQYALAAIVEGKLLVQTKQKQTLIVDPDSRKEIVTIPDNAMQLGIAGNKIFHSVSPEKFCIYDINAGKEEWISEEFLGYVDQVYLTKTGNVLKVHSMADGSVISEVKLDAEYYKSSKIDDFGFVVSTKDNKAVFIKLLEEAK
jgi:hypothetical protein